MGFLNKIKNKVLGSKKQQDEVLKTVKETRTISSTDKYSKGMAKSRDSFSRKVQLVFAKHREVNEEYFRELEEVLIMADIGVETTMSLIKSLKDEAKIKKITELSQMNELIFSFLFENYTDEKENLNKLDITPGELNVILIMGVNGVGKTTSIGKLTKKLISNNLKVSLVAADTFRAGAVEQLKVWADRNECSITIPTKEGQDPASVVFEGINKAKEDGTDVLLIDTAGRLHNKKNLMAELAKINNIIERESGSKAKETLLVLDATTGQNGVLQASSFNEVANLTGIILTKMDSSAKGGIIIAIKENFNIPVKYIGLGESLDDLEEFDLNKYLYGLTEGLEFSENE